MRIFSIIVLVLSGLLIGVVFAQGASAQTTTSTSTSTSTAGDTTVNAGGGGGGSAEPRRPVSSAYAPGLTSGSDVYMGSVSAGGQAITFGLAFGTTYVDKNCERLKNSRELAAMGLRDAALALICQDASVAKAVSDAGGTCPGAAVRVAEVVPVGVKVPACSAVGRNYNCD